MKKRLLILLTMPLLAATSFPSTFAHQFSPGEVIRYKYSYDITSGGARDRFAGEFRLSVKAVDGLVSTIVREQQTRTVVENLTLDSRMKATIERI